MVSSVFTPNCLPELAENVRDLQCCQVSMSRVSACVCVRTRLLACFHSCAEILLSESQSCHAECVSLSFEINKKYFMETGHCLSEFEPFGRSWYLSRCTVTEDYLCLLCLSRHHELPALRAALHMLLVADGQHSAHWDHRS